MPGSSWAGRPKQPPLKPAPRNPDALAQLALYCAKAGQEDCARQAGGEAIELQPDNPRFLHANAVVLILLGRTDDCLALLERAVRLGLTRAEIEATLEFSRLQGHPWFEDLLELAD
jgi:Flp pilus assembly protein TadD